MLERTLESELARAAARSTAGSAPPPAPTFVDSPTRLTRLLGSRRFGWAGVLALLNVVLSGFILMLWDAPRWNVTGSSPAGASAAAPARSTSSPPAAAAPSNRTTPVPAPRTPASRDAGSASLSPGRTLSPNPTAGKASGVGQDRLQRRDNGPAPAVSAPPGPPAPSARRTAPAAASDAPSRPPTNASASRSGPRPPTRGEIPPVTTITATPLTPVPGETARDGAGAPSSPAGAAVQTPPPPPPATTATDGPAPAAGVTDASRALAVAGQDGVTMPERLAASYVRPTIAAVAGGEPVTGEVRLRATVRVDGTVQDLQVVSSSRPGVGLEQSALAAVSRWRYKPATRDGEPVDARLTITVTFR